MRFATFRHRNVTRVGVVDADTGCVRPIQVASMIEAISLFEQGRAESAWAGESVHLDRVDVLAPIVPPRNIFCVGKNYRAHALEFAGSGYEAGAVKGEEIDDYPAVFTKPSSCIVGPGVPVDLHAKVTSAVDYEGELAVVIGKGGRGIARQDAARHIFGYTILNDVTARDRQKQHRQWFLGKALDTFCPIGPWIVTADEVDAGNLTLKTWVNDELRQDANTRDLIFDIPGLIGTISAATTLQTGDIIATGTPAGVGLGFTPPRFLRSGDVVTISIAGLGTLSNPFSHAPGDRS